MPVILDVFLPLSLAFIMFSLGLGLTVGDFVRVVEVPKAVAAGLFAQVMLLPVAAYAIVMVYDLPAELAVGVMILSFCPGGVTSNILTKLAGGAVALSITLTGIVSLLSVVTVPLLTDWSVGHLMGEKAPDIDVRSLAVAMVMITFVPVAIGLALRSFLPGFAAKAEPAVSRAATLLFVLVVLVAVVAGADTMLDHLTTLGPALITLIVLLLGLGFLASWVMGMEAPERVAISLETGVQNATLGITVGSLIANQAPGLPDFALPSAVYGVLMYVVVAPVILVLRRRLHGPALRP